MDYSSLMQLCHSPFSNHPEQARRIPANHDQQHTVTVFGVSLTAIRDPTNCGTSKVWIILRSVDEADPAPLTKKAI